MSAVMEDTLWTLEDLAARWKPSGPTPEARRKWIWRRIHEWGVPHDGNKKDPRFLPAAVRRSEDRAMGKS